MISAVRAMSKTFLLSMGEGASGMVVREEVIILDSSSSFVEDPAVAVIDLLSDGIEDDDEIALPLHERINRLLTANSAPLRLPEAVEPPPTGRSSLLDEFYAKWVLKQESVDVICEETAVLSQEITKRMHVTDETLVEGSTSAAAGVKRRKKMTGPRPAPLTPVELAPAPVLTGQLTRAPRTKEEACKEITLMIDRRINGRLQFAAQMDAAFRVEPECELEDPGMICWRRCPWDRPEAQAITRVCALVVDVEEDAGEGLLEADPEAFLGRIKTRFQPHSHHFTQIYLLFIGLKAYASKQAAKTNRNFRAAVLAGDRLPKESREAMSAPFSLSSTENRLWLASASVCRSDLQSPWRILFLDGIPQARQFLLEATRNVAWLPYDALWPANGPKLANGLKRSGQGADETLRLMLAMVPRVTPAMAQAIVQAYPSFPVLLRAFSAQGPTLLQGLRVEGTGRSIGPVISSRLHTVLLSTHPHLLIR